MSKREVIRCDICDSEPKLESFYVGEDSVFRPESVYDIKITGMGSYLDGSKREIDVCAKCFVKYMAEIDA